MLTVAKLDEVRKSSLTFPTTNGLYPVKTPSIGANAINSSLLTNGGAAGIAQHPTGIQSYAQAVISGKCCTMFHF